LRGAAINLLRPSHAVDAKNSNRAQCIAAICMKSQCFFIHPLSVSLTAGRPAAKKKENRTQQVALAERRRARIACCKHLAK
jgi:hypothetical protein